VQPFDNEIKLTLANNPNSTILSLNRLFNVLIIIKILDSALKMVEKNNLARISSIFIPIFGDNLSIHKFKVFAPNTKRWETLFGDEGTSFVLRGEKGF
jgi:hypothetical protein